MNRWSPLERNLAAWNLAPQLHVAAADVPAAHQWQTDHRQVKPGDWFIALVGSRHDGHQFVEAAFAAGAAGAVIAADAATPRKPHLRVSDTTAALGAIASTHRHSLTQRPLILALTGSVGKTTTRNMLEAIVQAAFGSDRVLATRGNENNHIGVPLLTLKLSPAQRAAVVEMGARHIGDIAVLVRVAAPDIVACLNAREAHLEIFGSLENLRRTKAEIFAPASSAHTAVIPADDPELAALAAVSGKRCYSFGLARGDIQVRDLRLDPHQGHTTFSLLLPDQPPLTCQIPSLLEAAPLNAAAAAAMSWAAGVHREAIVAGLAQSFPLPGRFQVRSHPPWTVIDDTYNANETSMMTGLRSLHRNFAGTPQLLVLGDMAELGPISEASHRRIGSFVATHFPAATLLTVGAKAQGIAAAAVAEGMFPDRVHWVATSEQAQAPFAELLASARVIYLKASRVVALDSLLLTLPGGH